MAARKTSAETGDGKSKGKKSPATKPATKPATAARVAARPTRRVRPAKVGPRARSAPVGSRDEAVVLGQLYTDDVTGYEGLATTRIESLYGCVLVALEGPLTPARQRSEIIVDEARLTDRPSATAGGPISGLVGELLA